MRITRYVNGTKTEKNELSKIFVTNELISSTIENVNKRLQGFSGKKDDYTINE